MPPPGAVAERLGRGLQSLVQRFESARRLRSPEKIPLFAARATPSLVARTEAADESG